MSMATEEQRRRLGFHSDCHPIYEPDHSAGTGISSVGTSAIISTEMRMWRVDSRAGQGVRRKSQTSTLMVYRNVLTISLLVPQWHLLAKQIIAVQ